MIKGLVSVVIPTYNRGEKIKETIDSIENNEFPKEKFEIIIVDDFSTKENSEIIRKIISKEKNVRYFKNQKNLGPSASRNRGIKLAKGEFIFFTDDDCLPPKNWISEYVKFFQEHPKIAGVGGCCTPSSKNLIAKYEELKDHLLKIRVKKLEIGKEVPVGFTGNVAYRKKILDEIGGFNGKLKRGEDVELKKRITKKYSVAAFPLLVIHNHNYNLSYFLSSLIKEGLNKIPPEKNIEKIKLIILNFPSMIINSSKKLKTYRSR